MAERPRSEAQRAASRANGRRSQGPKTAAGKTMSRRNALRHGLRATTLEVLPKTESHPAAALLAAVRQELAPRDVMESECVEGIATAFWRLRRARRLEEALLAGIDPPSDSDPRSGTDTGTPLVLGSDPDQSEAVGAEAFAGRRGPAASMALLLRYRSQALGELDRWFRLLEARRAGAAVVAAPGEKRRAATRNATTAANDNAAAPPASFS